MQYVDKINRIAEVTQSAYKLFLDHPSTSSMAASVAPAGDSATYPYIQPRSIVAVTAVASGFALLITSVPISSHIRHLAILHTVRVSHRRFWIGNENDPHAYRNLGRLTES